jgi:hypothetical protein
MTKKSAFILDDGLSAEPATLSSVVDPQEDDGDICTPKTEPSTEDDQPLD